MAVTLNKANLVLKDANGNIGKIEQLSNRDLAKIKTAVSDVALVVNQSNHKPIVATTTNVGMVKPDGRTITIDSNGTLTCDKTIVPVTGEIKWFAFNKAPNGYLVCNGAQVSRTTYADLFKAIGTTFGKGNGSTTFNLPDLRDRYIIGANTNALGTKIAEQLPNIKGGLVDDYYGHLLPGSDSTRQYGAITYTEKRVISGSVGTSDSNLTSFTLNAHNSNSIYTDDGHVYPFSLALLPCIKY